MRGTERTAQRWAATTSATTPATGAAVLGRGARRPPGSPPDLHSTTPTPWQGHEQRKDTDTR